MADVDVFQTWQVLLGAGAYALATLGLSYGSSFPARAWLLARIRHLKSQEAYRDAPTLEALTETERDLKKLWGRTSRVQAGWRLVHGVEDQEVMEYPDGEVIAALESMQDRLALLDDDEGAQSLGERIAAALEGRSVTAEARPLLREAQAYRHNLNDYAYEELASLMSKATFLAIVGAALVVVLAELGDREAYFVLGAAGGLMSRLTRIVRERPSTNDYGATWSTLILSPVSGALAGWIGVALVAALGSDPVSFIDDGIPPLVWEQTDHVFGLALAFLLGFSERLFSSVVDVSDDRFEGLTTQRPLDRGRERTRTRRGGRGRGRRGRNEKPRNRTPGEARGGG
jgi:hypothetical protein